MKMMDLFKRKAMPLRRKLLGAMLVPAFLIGTVGVVGVFSLMHLEKAAGQILSKNYSSIQEAMKMERTLRLLESLSVNANNENVTSQSIGVLIRQFDKALSKCEKNITEQGECNILKNLRINWKNQRSHIQSIQSDSTVDKIRIMHRANISVFRDLDELIELNEKAMFSYERKTRKVGRLMVLGVSGAFISALIALVTLAIISANRISKPISKVAGQLHKALNPSEESIEEDILGRVDEIERLRQELDDLLSRLAHYEDEQTRKLNHLQGRLAFVINEVLEGLALLDNEHRILTVNRVARSILNIQKEEETDLSALKPHPDVAGILNTIIEGNFHPERDLGEFGFEINGNTRVYRPRILTISSKDGAIEGYLLLFWDVTEQRRFEDSRRRFISMLSHQLKTPMTSLSMSINLLKEKLEPASPHMSELMSIATENCNSLSNLISELIDASREVKPDLSLTPRFVDLAGLLRSALRPLKPQAEEKEINLVFPPQKGELHAWVDPVKFPWVITNLVGNALRYTNPHGQITVTVEKLSSSLVVQVADSGSGISEKYLTHIFSPYVSLDNEPMPGTHGLGLAIVKEIVQAHNGTIRAESKIGKGTTFKIKIPISSGGKQ
ncbi:MAG: MCP four helix bundle domain-containing protein [Victivallales bacterium]|nr:MCP four helix bundle domain-containing protein [Victivallales bacterium]